MFVVVAVVVVVVVLLLLLLLLCVHVHLKNTSVQWIKECLFTDDGSYTSCFNKIRCRVCGTEVSKDSELTIRIPKTKHMVDNRLVERTNCS